MRPTPTHPLTRLALTLTLLLPLGAAQATPLPSIASWMKIPTPPAPPPSTTWTIDPGPALAPDAASPRALWFDDGLRALVELGPYDDRALWSLQTQTGAWTKLTGHLEDADVAPDALRVAVATRSEIQIISWRPTAVGTVERAIPWPGYVEHARRLIAWLDDHTLLRMQQHDTEDPTDGGSYGWYSYRCEVIDLRADPPSVTEQPCPEGGFSFIADIASDAHRLLITSSAEGCLDLSAALYAPGKPQQPLVLPTLQLYPAGDFTFNFAHSKDLLLLSPCELDLPDKHRECNPARDPAPWHLFLWSASFDHPKRLYSDLPPYAITDAAARNIAWPVPGGLCIATLDPPSARTCWPTP